MMEDKLKELSAYIAANRASSVQSWQVALGVLLLQKKIRRLGTIER
jgi:hypothetical protein